MKNREKSIIRYFSILVVVSLVSGCINNTKECPSPEGVVKTYFTQWNNNEYVTMYDQIPGDFKKMDSQTKVLNVFSI